MFRSYTPSNPPQWGNALKIWRGLGEAGCEMMELHYNPNCWMRPGTSVDGWGTWACTYRLAGEHQELWCGVWEGQVFVQIPYAPFTMYFAKPQGGVSHA